MGLPQIKFCLPEWRPMDFAMIDSNKKRIADLLQKTGRGSDKFSQSCKRIMALVDSNNAHLIPGLIKAPVDVRALTYLFGRQDFHDHAAISEKMIESLYSPKPKLSLISLYQLIYAFFLYFDQIGTPTIFDLLCKLLHDELKNHCKGKPSQDIVSLSQNKKLIFALSGPQNIVEYATNHQTDLDNVFKEFCLQNYYDTRFHKICRFRYYINKLKELPVGENHSVLSEVCKTEVYDAPANKGHLLGHEILSILIDRSSNQTISDAWRGVILTIAGDPRVPNTNPRFQKWWSILGIKRQKKVKEWLSGFDLRLFLEALENYGIVSGNSDLQRMFKARKTFLEGLLKQKLILHARLFVGSSPERYLLGSYKKEELPEYARVRDTYRSIIYLQIANCHMIEGSHSCKLWLFANLPENADAYNYSIESFLPFELTTKLEKQYWKNFGKSAKAPISIIHHPNLAWQWAALKFLHSEGIFPDIEKLLEPGDYRKFKIRYGLRA